MYVHRGSLYIIYKPSNTMTDNPGRFCSDVLGPSCCLPCPQTEWLYADNFTTMTTAANWINVASIICSVFLITSWAFLPAGVTHRHYLSICLTIATMMMSVSEELILFFPHSIVDSEDLCWHSVYLLDNQQRFLSMILISFHGINLAHNIGRASTNIVIQMGFIIPLGAKPNPCFDDITPNSMKTSTTCALSGAFLLSGGWAAVMWVFTRAVALHLQICWQVVIGKTFMFGALAAGWGIPAIGLAVALIFSGVSFRFGDTCHINHKNSKWSSILCMRYCSFR